MKSDLIDIQVESRGNDVELTLSGSLGVAQLTALKEKLDILTQLIFSERQTVKTQIQLIDEQKTRIAHLAQENIDLRKEIRAAKNRRD
jgi:hypothetical protein